MNAFIFDIYRGTTNDGPGIRDTVFFKGCPLSCKWCHNPEGIGFKNQMWYEKRICMGCGLCAENCPHKAIEFISDGIRISEDLCKVCRYCTEVCPTGAISAIAKEYTPYELAEEIISDREYFDVSQGGSDSFGR